MFTKIALALAMIVPAVVAGTAANTSTSRSIDAAPQAAGTLPPCPQRWQVRCPSLGNACVSIPQCPDYQ
jgi:invasion protein IalB